MRTLAGEFGPVEEQDLNDAVIRAAGVGYADIVTCLLAKGADPDAEDPYGETPLIHAAAGNHIREFSRKIQLTLSQLTLVFFKM